MWLRSVSRQGEAFFLACAAAVLLIVPWADGKQSKVDVLRIGSSGRLGPRQDPTKEKASLETLKAFVKDETGLDNEIIQEKDWRALADKMAQGKDHVGVFEGAEFVWAREKHSGLKPLAMAVNVYRYPVVYVVANRTNPAKDFASLQGQTLSVPATGQGFLRLFVDRQCEAIGKKSDGFFSRITEPGNVEDALDDVVDGVVQVTAVDKAALEAYKKRKPARFKQLKPIVHSQPLLPGVVAYYGNVLDEATRRRFQQGLVNANRSEKGKMMLALFHLTGFSTIPNDFEKVAQRMLKDYPPPKESR